MEPAFRPTFKPDLQYLNHSELIEQLDQRMKPGGCSQAGFQAENEKLLEICLKDSTFLQNRRITHEQIADRLEAILIKADFLLRQPRPSHGCFLDRSNRVAIIGKTLEVPTYFSTCGIQECPFSEDLADSKTWCGTGTSKIKIINMISGKCLNNITELHVHLIRDHHFFQGNTEYRLDPEAAIEVLGIESEIDYHVKTITDKSWKGIEYLGEFDEKILLAARENKINTFQSEFSDFEAYLLPYSDWETYKYRGLTYRQKIEKEGLENKKSVKQINQDIVETIQRWKMFTQNPESRMDEQIWRSEGNNYLHVFTHKLFSNNPKFFPIGDAVISGEDLKRPNNHTIFESITSRIPILEEGDYVK